MANLPDRQPLESHEEFYLYSSGPVLSKPPS